MTDVFGAILMPHYQLRVLCRPKDGAGPVETTQAWIEAKDGPSAIVRAHHQAEAALKECSGVAMLMSEDGAMLWSVRKDLPKLTGLSGRLPTMR